MCDVPSRIVPQQKGEGVRVPVIVLGNENLAESLWRESIRIIRQCLKDPDEE